MSYVYDQYVFHYVVSGGICYLCMSDELNKHRIPYAFLNDIQEQFLKKYGTEKPQKAIAFAMNEAFSPILKARMEYYNTDKNPTVDNISSVKNQIEEVKDVMVQNIEKVLERGEKIELLVDKTDRLSQQAFRFESTSRNLRRNMWWKKVRFMVGVAVALGIVVWFLSSSFCGGFDFHKCKSSRNDSYGYDYNNNENNNGYDNNNNGYGGHDDGGNYGAYDRGGNDYDSNRGGNGYRNNNNNNNNFGYNQRGDDRNNYNDDGNY